MTTRRIQRGRKYTDTCSVEGCASRFYAKGYCVKHYSRLQNHGDPLAYLPGAKKRAGCAIDGCERPYQAQGYCSMHYTRVRKHGDPRHEWVPTGRPPKADHLGYDAAHRRVRRERGPASQHSCIDCGKPAREWSYRGGDPAELISGSAERREHPGMPYSIKPEFYDPRCTSCHRIFDDTTAGRLRDAQGRMLPSDALYGPLTGEPPQGRVVGRSATGRTAREAS